MHWCIAQSLHGVNQPIDRVQLWVDTVKPIRWSTIGAAIDDRCDDEMQLQLLFNWISISIRLKIKRLRMEIGKLWGYFALLFRGLKKKRGERASCVENDDIIHKRDRWMEDGGLEEVLNVWSCNKRMNEWQQHQQWKKKKKTSTGRIIFHFIINSLPSVLA